VCSHTHHGIPERLIHIRLVLHTPVNLLALGHHHATDWPLTPEALRAAVAQAQPDQLRAAARDQKTVAAASA